MWISMLLSLCLTLYTISIILYYANQLTPCLSHHTMSITLYYGNHFIYNSPYIPTLIWNFLQYSISNFGIFEIIFYLSSTWTLISFVCNGFLKSFLFKLQKMVNTWKKKLIFTCLCLFLLETHSVPLHKVFYISQTIAYFVSTWESRPPRYTACQSQALIRFFKCYFNYFCSQNNIIINIASACFLFLYFFILTRNNTCTMYGTSL